MGLCLTLLRTINDMTERLHAADYREYRSMQAPVPMAKRFRPQLRRDRTGLMARPLKEEAE